MDWNELAKLVEQIQSGHSEALNLLYERTLPYVLSRTRYQLKNESDAEDAAQEVYIEVFKSIDKLSDPQSIGAWLKTITLRICYKYYSKTADLPMESILDDEGNPMEIEFEDDRGQLENVPSGYIESQETKENLFKMIEALPQTQRDTMIYFYYDNLKIREIAEIMGCNENTVKSRLNYAKKTMETEITEKRRKGIMFPAIIPWPLISRQLYGSLEGMDAEVAPEVVARISEGISNATKGTAGAGSVGGSGTAGGNVGFGASVATRGLLGTKAIVGIIAAVLVVAIGIGVAVLNRGDSEPVIDSDYAHIYYDYIQNEVLPTGYYDDGGLYPFRFIDADMIHLDRSEKPILIMSYTKYESTDDSIREGFTLHEYNNQTGKVEQVQTHESSGLGEYMSYISCFIVEVDGSIGIGTLFETVDQNGDYTGANLNVYEMPVNIYNQQYHVYNGEGYEEMIRILNGQVGTWGFSSGEAVMFPIAVEGTNGERLRDYFN